MNPNEWNYPARFQKLHAELDKTNAALAKANKEINKTAADFKCQIEINSALEKMYLASKADCSKNDSRIKDLEREVIEIKFNVEIGKGIGHTVESMIGKMTGGKK
jgi:hypothetical protein